MLAMAWTLPPALASSRPTAVPSVTWLSPTTRTVPKTRPSDDRQHPLAADRLDDRVGGVDADEHQHEEEEHQDGAGVDDDLHREEERRVQRGVEDRQADHHHGQQQRGVHGLADEQDAERGEHHDRGEDPEGHRAPSVGPARCGSSRPRRRRAASGAAAAPCRAAAGPAGRTSRRSGRRGCCRPARTRWSSSARGSGTPRCTARRGCSAGS